MSESDKTETHQSVNDKKAISIWNETIRHREDGHYEVAIPFVQYPPALENNVSVAKQRLQGLEARLTRDPSLHAMYKESMTNLLSNGYAEEVPDDELCLNPVWYLPHHAVTSPSKPGQVRVVFDCSAKHCGKSLNNVVLQGPDLTNKLVGVLLRFRQERIAVVSDTACMFHQVHVTDRDRDLLRFLWWRDGDLDGEPHPYRMKVHLFGGVWSPSCCNFMLRRTAEDCRDQYDPEVVDTILNSFYVDDCLKSVDTVHRAKHIVQQMCDLLSYGGFHLTKFISNSREVMSAIPEEDWSKEVKNRDLQCQTLPVERALGVKWDVEADTFSFAANIKEKPVTRRGILSVVSSIFDPLGFMNPFMLPAKRIIQELCRKKVMWDSPLSIDDEQSWRRWLRDLEELTQLKVGRCLKPVDFDHVTTAELHHFSDASCSGYGAVSYLRQCDVNGRIHCSFVISKARVAPLRETTIPRLELCAAVLSAKLDGMIRNEMDITVSRSVFWTDSSVVLQYVHNEDKRFHTFVANRISVIHTASTPAQWRYVNSELNPADDVSRGLSAEGIMNSSRWFGGPRFLWQDEESWPQNPVLPTSLPDHDPEVRKDSAIYASQTDCNQIFDRIMKKRSSWFELKKDVGYILRMKFFLKSKVNKLSLPDISRPFTVAELAEAELHIIRYVQQEAFTQEMKTLSKGSADTTVQRSSALYRLEPVMHEDGLIRIGGRLPSHPIVIPNQHDVTNLIIRHFHIMSGHCGKEHTLAQVRQLYWVIRGRSAVHRVLGNCARCKLRDVKPCLLYTSPSPRDS